MRGFQWGDSWSRTMVLGAAWLMMALPAQAAMQAATQAVEVPVFTLVLPGAPVPAKPAKASKAASANKKAPMLPREGEFAVTLRGEVRFNETEDDIAALSGSLHILQVLKGRQYLIEYLSDDENVLRAYYLDGRKRDFDADGRAWLAQAIPLFLRESGWMAHERAQRLLMNKGPAAVLEEASRIRAGYQRSMYLREAVEGARLGRDDTERALALTIATEGDIGRRDVFIALLRRQQLDAAQLRRLLASTASFAGPFEKRAVLVEAVPRLPALADDAALLQAFASALAGVIVDGEVRHVLNEFDRIDPMPAPLLATALEATRRLKSPFERRQLLELFAARVSRQPPMVPAYLDIAGGLRAPAERRAALVALARTGRLDAAACRSLLGVAADIAIDSDLREVMVTLGAQMPAERELLLAYRRLAARLNPADRRSALQAIARYDEQG